jgi:NAD(P)-dependent dehydrogenase (short-subunit alcohol dehydrogenase family)
MTDEDWYKVLAVNLSGAFFVAQAVLPHMIERGTGRIINNSSLVEETGNIGQANHAASKSGLFGLTKSLARETCFHLQRTGKLGKDSIGITVNTVAPRVHRDRDARDDPREGSRASADTDPGRAVRAPGRNRAGSALPRLRLFLAHHRTGVGDEWGQEI